MLKDWCNASSFIFPHDQPGCVVLDSLEASALHYLVLRRCGHAYTETATADGGDDLAGGVADQDEATRGHVLLHGATQCVLRVTRQAVNLHQHHHCTTQHILYW